MDTSGQQAEKCHQSEADKKEADNKGHQTAAFDVTTVDTNAGKRKEKNNLDDKLDALNSSQLAPNLRCTPLATLRGAEGKSSGSHCS